MLSFQCTLVHHLGCERTFTKVEQMKWHLKSRDHKRFPVISLFGDILVFHIQRSPLFCGNIVKKDPGRAGQNSLATAGTNFTKPGVHNKGDLQLSVCKY